MKKAHLKVVPEKTREEKNAFVNRILESFQKTSWMESVIREAQEEFSNLSPSHKEWAEKRRVCLNCSTEQKKYRENPNYEETGFEGICNFCANMEIEQYKFIDLKVAQAENAVK